MMHTRVQTLPVGWIDMPLEWVMHDSRWWLVTVLPDESWFVHAERRDGRMYWF